MNSELTRELLDSFYLAQQAFATLPALPQGMTSQYVHILDAITIIEAERGTVRVSDVADWFHVSIPGMTRSLHALEGLGAIRKERGTKDRREVKLALTDRGRLWYRIYVEQYHEKLAEILHDIPDADVQTTVRTIQSAVSLMHEHPIVLSEDTSSEDMSPVQTSEMDVI